MFDTYFPVFIAFIVSSDDLLDVVRHRYEIHCDCGNRVGIYVTPRKKKGVTECLLVFVRPVPYDSTNSSQDYSKVGAIRVFRANRPVRSVRSFRSRRAANFSVQDFDLDVFVDQAIDEDDENDDNSDADGSSDDAETIPSTSKSQISSELANIETPLNVYSDPIPSTSASFPLIEENALSAFNDAVPSTSCVYSFDACPTNLDTLAAVCVGELPDTSHEIVELENAASTADAVMTPIGEGEISGAIYGDRM